MRTKYTPKIMLPVALAFLAGCASVPRPNFVGRINDVERFVGDKESIEAFANRHFLDIYNTRNGGIYAEGVTASRHRYEASTSTNFLDGCATDGCKAADAVKRK